MSFTLSQLDTRDWLVIAATIAGPILAVQAQKWVELLRERRNRKLWVFQQLMATRAARVSTEHVQALNMIDLVFYGSRWLGIRRRSRTEQNILDAWKEYHDHLGVNAEGAAVAVWNVRREELFINLLFAIAQDVRFKFDRVELKKGHYSPMAHGDLEAEQTVIRKSLVKLLSGENALKMDVTSFPLNDDALKAQVGLQTALSDALTGKGALNVTVKRDDPNA